MKNFIVALLTSKKFAVTVAAEAVVHALPMSADAKGIATALIALAYVLGQAYVDANTPPPPPDPPTLH